MSASTLISSKCRLLGQRGQKKNLSGRSSAFFTVKMRARQTPHCSGFPEPRWRRVPLRPAALRCLLRTRASPSPCPCASSRGIRERVEAQIAATVAGHATIPLIGSADQNIVAAGGHTGRNPGEGAGAILHAFQCAATGLRSWNEQAADGRRFKPLAKYQNPCCEIARGLKLRKPERAHHDAISFPPLSPFPDGQKMGAVVRERIDRTGIGGRTKSKMWRQAPEHRAERDRAEPQNPVHQNRRGQEAAV